MLKDSDRSGELESHLSQWCGVRGFAPREKFASFEKMLCAKKKKKKKQCCQGTAFKMDMSSLELCTCFEKMCIYGAYWFTFTLMCKI